jgi:hypothetical protein
MEVMEKLRSLRKRTKLYSSVGGLLEVDPDDLCTIVAMD